LKSDGTFAVWGQDMANNGSSDVLSPQTLNVSNYPALTGTPLKATIGGNGGTSSEQFVVLTTTGLYAWGNEGYLLDASLTTNSNFQKIATPGGGDTNLKLPSGVAPTDVATLFGTYQTLAIVTTAGKVWVLTKAAASLQGNNAALAATTWHEVKTNASTSLTGVIALRGQVSSGTYGALMALTASGQVYAWGPSVYLGNGSASASKSYATPMVLPSEFTNANVPKMIGVTGGIRGTATVKNTFFLLSNTGSLYALGDNSQKQCGDFTTTERKTWVNSKINASTNYTNVNYITVQEHDASYPAVAITTKNGDLYSWGENGGKMIGRTTDGDTYDPGYPLGFTSGSDIALSAELGGHTLVYLKEGSSQFCYVGHRTNGSMGDGTSTGSFEDTFNCSGTPSLDICGSVPVAASLTTSTISASPTSIVADGISTSTISIQLKDASGVNLTTSGGIVVVTTSDGTLGTVVDNNDGTYTVILTSPINAGTATIGFSINGTTATNTTTVTFTATSGGDSTPPVITGPNGANGTTTGANASKSIPENTVNVYTFTANESVTWSITGGADQVKFTIDPNTGLLRFVSPPDYENPTDVDADNVYMVVLTATDAAGNTTSQTVAVTVTFVCGDIIYGTGYLSGGNGTDSNWKVVALPQGFSPAQPTPYNAFVINGTLPGTFVHRNGYTDANGNTFYWVAPKPDASELLSSPTLYNWIIKQSITVPSTGFYDLNFSVAGDDEITMFANGTIDNTNPLQPTIVGGTQIGSSWNTWTATTTFAGKVYLTAGINQLYMVVEDTGSLTAALISDGSFACTPLLNGPGAGLTSTKSIPENTTDVFTFTSDEPVTWSLSGGEDAAKFSINASGKLVFVSAPDFENPTDGTTTGSNTYIVVVKALSTLTGLYTEQTVTVTVTDVDETAPIITGPTTGGGTTTGAASAKSVPENTIAVNTFTANELVTWSLGGGADQARFTINPTSGLVSFNPAPDFENPTDADANNTYIVIIKATDAAGNFTTQTFTVTVTDVVENLAPTNITLSKMNLFEANAIGAVIGNLTTTDPDVGDTHTYTLVSGAGSTSNANFTISGNQLKAGVIFSYITQSTYSIRIRTTDAGGLSFEKVFSITISESPTVKGTGYNISTGITPATSNPVISKGYFSNLTVSGTNLVGYSWTPVLNLSNTNTANPTATPSQTTTYAVTVTNSFGSSTVLYITVTVVEDYNITPRNAITPNGDGKNDTWVVANITSYPNNQVRIFDRAGRLLFVESNYQNGWDGTVNGMPLKEDTYYFVITFGPGVNPKKGFISIIR
jgi:gliding motility-associated-like protein